MVARTRYALPLSPSLERKFGPLRDRFDLRVLATSADGRPHDDGTFQLVPRAAALDGLAFWVLLPLRVRRIARRHKPNAILTQGPYEGVAARLAATGAPVVVEIHGDWRTATRLYGRGARRLLAPLADRVAAWGIRHARRVRTLSPFTTGLIRALGVETAGEFTAYLDLGVFVDRLPVPLPEQPLALFVGVLEPYKNVDGLERAWRRAAPQVPDAALRIVGRGPRSGLVQRLAADLPGQTTWVERLTPEEIARALDAATCLVLPSRSEGLPRIAIEALCRGRPIIGARAGGIPDIVQDDVNGLIVDGDDELADALVRMLGDGTLAQRLAAGAEASAGRWRTTPDEYADKLAALVAPYTGTGP